MVDDVLLAWMIMYCGNDTFLIETLFVSSCSPHKIE
jgi:hypothetical protein